MSPREAVARSIAGYEGGDSNQANDRGGLTHYGLTLETFQEHKPDGTAAELLALSRDDVIDIITELRALKPGYFQIADPWLMWAVIDFSINSGSRAATKALQRAIGVIDDGVFGRHTELTLQAMNPDLVYRKFIAQRLRFLGQDLRARPNQVKFADGWLVRVATFLELQEI